MVNLKEQLSEKGAKCKLQFSAKERDYYIKEAGFTDEEIEIFTLRTRGYSLVKIQMTMQELHNKYYSESVIDARIRSIKDKILNIL
jgi:hypothetical protein